MKVRIYSPLVPYPVTHGAAQVIFDQARSLAALGHQVELVCWRGRDFETVSWPDVPVRTRFWKGDSFLDHKLARLLRTAVGQWSSPELQHYPVRLDRRRELDPVDLGIYHFGYALPWLVRGLRTERRRCVHMHNLESDLYRQRSAAVRDVPGRLLHGLNARRLLCHEAQLAYACDEIWFLSPVDLATYRDRTGATNLRLVPPTYDRSGWQGTSAGARDIGFLGALDFRPNQVSVEWLLEEICPGLQAGGFTGRLLIAGRNPPRHLYGEVRKYDFVHLLGFVPDLASFWQAVKCTLVPHIEGSGVRTKLLESVSKGVPVLVDEAAARMVGDALDGMYVCRSPADWVHFILGQVGPLEVGCFPTQLDGNRVYGFLDQLTCASDGEGIPPLA